MNKIPNNLKCFEISQENPEPHLDHSYFLIDKDPDLDKYIKSIKEIKEVLITIKKLKEGEERADVLEKYYQKLFDLFKEEFSNCSELGCFVNACDTTRDMVQKDFKIFKYITDTYLKNRVLDELVPENWVQAILDSNSSRKKGALGERKLIGILSKLGFDVVKNWETFAKSKKCLARFSKEIFSIEKVREFFDIKLPLKKQNKRLDLVIKDGENIFILEAKHSNVGGGEQDKQISELIEILGLRQEKKNIYFVSFLDGTYSNVLLGKISKRAKKLLKQRQEISRYLKRNPNSYWVNTAGFKEIFK